MSCRRCVYHRSILEAWVKNYLPSAHIVGANETDIIYADEIMDRPVSGKEHVAYYITYKDEFLLRTFVKNPIQGLCYDVIELSKKFPK